MGIEYYPVSDAKTELASQKNIHFQLRATASKDFLKALKSASGLRIKASFKPEQLLDKYYVQTVLLLGCRIFELQAGPNAADAARNIREVSQWNRTPALIFLKIFQGNDAKKLIMDIMPDRIIAGSELRNVRELALLNNIWAEK